MPEQTTTELRKLIEKSEWAALKKKINSISPHDIVELLFLADAQDRAIIFRSLSRESMAEVFSLLEPEEQDSLLHTLTDKETSSLLAALSPDDRTAIFEELPSGLTRKLLGLLSNEDLMEARMLLGYPDESVGRLMTPDYIAVTPDITVRETIEYIRKYGSDSETIMMIYIVDSKGKLLDEIRLRRIILANPDDKISSLMDSDFVCLSAFDDREKAVNTMLKYDLLSLPVIDSDGDLIGIVTFDDVMDVAEEEATEDMQKSASISPLKMSYHRADIVSLFKKRIGWLVALVAMNLLTASILSFFSGELSKAIILVSFMPMLLGSGGNTGSQASTLMIRALVTGDINLSQWVSTIGKELVVGLVLGLTVGICAGAIAYFMGGFNVGISVVVALSMLLIVVYANIVGTSMPFFLAKLGVDPAVASGPLISTITDASGLIIYFIVAMIVLNL